MQINSIRSHNSKGVSELGASTKVSARNYAIQQQPIKATHESLQRPLTTDSKNSMNQTTQVWVTKWIDYSAKYGLGYLLSDMSAGVFFNDSTKIVAESSGNQFFYYERKQGVNNEKQDMMSQFTFQTYPPDLQKKVTLLQHFKSYLE